MNTLERTQLRFPGGNVAFIIKGNRTLSKAAVNINCKDVIMLRNKKDATVKNTCGAGLAGIVDSLSCILSKHYPIRNKYPETVPQYLDMELIDRMGGPGETVAKTCSETSSFITGYPFAIDGRIVHRNL